MLTSSFDDAIKEGAKEYEEHKNDRKIIIIEEEWKFKNIKTPGSVGITTNEVAFPYIDVHYSQSAEWQCDSQGQYGCQHYDLVVYCDLTFVNTGNDQGQKCVDVYTYVDDAYVQKKVVCETIGANENQETRVDYIDHGHANVAFTYMCELG
jgi:hypothetical protein